MEKLHFEQAKIWHTAARHTAEAGQGPQRYAVAYVMVILAIIKANDALTLKFLGRTARRHEQARMLFEELVKRNCISAAHAHFKQTIQDAINGKADAEYRGGFISKGEYDVLERKAEKFLKMVAETLRI